MLTVHEPFHLIWEEFHDPFGDGLSKDRTAGKPAGFDSTVESMIQASIPAEPMKRLQDVWTSLGLKKPLSAVGEYWDETWCSLKLSLSGPNQLSEDEAGSLVYDLWNSQEDEAVRRLPVSPDAEKEALSFLKELKYTALCTAWQFTFSWSAFTASLPDPVQSRLRHALFQLTMFVVIRQLLDS